MTVENEQTPSLKLLVLKSPQLEIVRDFCQLLGFEFVEERHGNGPVHYSTSLGTGVLEIYPLPDGIPTDTTTLFGFSVANIDAVAEAVSAVGELVSKPKATQWGVRAVVRDPDGRTVELYQATVP